jgi:hypothetical protein
VRWSALARPGIGGTSGAAAVVGGGLSMRFDRRTRSLAWVAMTSNARARRLHQVFGDQAMFVRREARAPVECREAVLGVETRDAHERTHQFFCPE